MAKKSTRRPLFLLLVGVILLLGCVGVVAGYLYVNAQVTAQFGSPMPNLTMTQRVIYPLELFIHQKKLTFPKDVNGAEQSFTVAQDESVAMVCIRLEQAEIISEAEIFRTYLVYSGLDRQLQSGQYTLSSSMSPMQIAADLLDATPRDVIITILPGWRIEEVAANVASSGLVIDAEVFSQMAYNPPPDLFQGLSFSQPPTLEGYLFPGAYVVPREATLEQVMGPILATFSTNLDVSLVDGFERQGLSLQEAVTLASIVEKEAVVDEEKPLIASVFYNRLAVGMKLETDPTVQYALGCQEGSQTWWKSPLSFEDLRVESDFNTYLVYGLPPAPICNPDLGSLQSVAFPAETPYYYFRAACDGSGRHNFAITYEEHLNNGCD